MDWIARTRLIVFPLCISPLLWLSCQALHNNLGTDPANALTRDPGELALQFLCLTLILNSSVEI